MKAAFLILAVTDVALLTVTAVVGFWVRGEAHFQQHFALGLLSSLYTIFVHVATFTYFAVTMRIVRQASDAGTIAPGGAVGFERCKTRAFLAAGGAIVTMVVVSALGAIVTEPGYAASWGLSPGVHGAAGIMNIGLNLAAFAYEYVQIDRNARLFAETFGGA